MLDWWAASFDVGLSVYVLVFGLVNFQVVVRVRVSGRHADWHDSHDGERRASMFSPSLDQRISQVRNLKDIRERDSDSRVLPCTDRQISDGGWLCCLVEAKTAGNLTSRMIRWLQKRLLKGCSPTMCTRNGNGVIKCEVTCTEPMP